MIKSGIARTVGRAILRVLPALLLILACLNLGWLMLAAPVSAEQTGSPTNLFAGIAAGGVGQPTADQPVMGDYPSDAEDTEAIDYPIGIFITSLHDLDVTADTFGVDYWVWSIHPPELNPLETLEFYNAKEAHADLGQTAERGDRSWSQRKISAVVRHDWDLSNFPFDRQVLNIVLEEGAADTTALMYSADTANSGYKRTFS